MYVYLQWKLIKLLMFVYNATEKDTKCEIKDNSFELLMKVIERKAKLRNFIAYQILVFKR